MSDLLQRKWELSEDAVANAVGAETVILHLGNGTYFGLDSIGTRLWNGLQSGSQPEEICTQILADYDVPRETLVEDLNAFLRDLAEHDLIVPV